MSAFTRRPVKQRESDAIAHERAAFCDFVQGLSDFDLGVVEPLPYRRILSSSESEFLWAQLRGRWEIGSGYWTSSEFNWILYVPHESSITADGWLLGEIKRQWPDWNQHTWKSPGT